MVWFAFFSALILSVIHVDVMKPLFFNIKKVCQTLLLLPIVITCI